MRKLGRAISVFNYLQALTLPPILLTYCSFNFQEKISLFKYLSFFKTNIYLFENFRLRGKGVPHRKIRTHHAVSLSHLFFIHCLLERFLQEKPAYDPLSINSINHAFAVDYVAVITYI